jgi:hypothetical protein
MRAMFEQEPTPMDDTSKAKFTDALAEASKLLELAQAQLQRARAQTSGDLYERTDLIAKRAFELKVKADWIRYSLLGKIELTAANDRIASDRRVGLDRRIVGMQRKLLAAAG